MAEEIKVAILEQKIEDLKHIVVRIDTAIEKLGEVNSNVSRMLAVHEERITKQEEVDSILFAKIDKLRDKMDGDHDLIRSRLALLEQRVWMLVGGLAVLTIGVRIVTTFPQILTSLQEPSRIEKSNIR